MGEPSRDLAGTRLGGFLLEKKLGEGGFGAVYRGRPSVGVPRAIKTLHERTLVEALRKEAETLLALKHENVVEMLHADLDAEVPYLVMELVEGGSLAGRLPLDEKSWLPTCRGILTGLAHAHARGVAHLDLMPQNILIAPSGPKIADFGLAHLLAEGVDHSLPASSGTAGTVAYMAPDQR